MSLPFKTIQSAVTFFKDELNSFYDASELDLMLQITFLHYLKLSRTDIVFNKDKEILELDFQKIIEVVTALKANKPLAQIIGEWEFYGLTLKVNEHTLIPRPETEELVQLITNDNNIGDLNILDIGTGTGCIALSLKKNVSNSTVFAYDVSDKALEIAKDNAKVNKLDVTFDKVDILNWKNHSTTIKFDVIVSNPPYITMKEKVVMHKNVLDYEPHLALFVDDKEPLLFYDAISDFALKNLKKDGKLYFEINENYGGEVKQLLMNKGFKNVNIVKDINEKERIVSCNVN